VGQRDAISKDDNRVKSGRKIVVHSNQAVKTKRNKYEGMVGARLQSQRLAHSEEKGIGDQGSKSNRKRQRLIF